MNFDFCKCESLIGYVFKDKNLLINAFTHSSYSNEHKEFKSNERLEFLGDSVLGLVVSEYLYKNYSQSAEGKMTVLKQGLVSKKPLSTAIMNKGLDKFLMLGEGEKKETARTNISENLFEAIVASIYLDGGLKNAEKFIFSMLDLSEASQNSSSDVDTTDYKSKLLRLSQCHKLGDIEYYEISKTGPDHKPVFLMGVRLGGRNMATGQGSSHKEGEKFASKKAIEILQSEGYNL